MNKTVRCLLTFAACLAILPAAGAGNKNAISYNAEGQEQLLRGEYQRALFSFRNALKQNPNYEDALVGLGKAYLNLEVYDQAMELFDKVLEANPSSGEALTSAGFIHVKKGNYQEALSCFNRAVEVSAENIDARYGIALMHYSMGKTLWAERQLETVLGINPYHLDGLLLLASIRRDQGRASEASDLASRAISANNNSVRGYISFAEILFREYLLKGDKDDMRAAAFYLDAALGLQPDAFNANSLLADMLLYSGRYGEAVGFYKKAAEAFPSALVAYRLGCCYDKLGDKEAALKQFLQTLRDSPSDEIGASRLEQFLVAGDFKTGHPANVMRGNDNFATARKRMSDKLSDEAILYLRRCLMLNPLNRDCREALMQYYSAMDYNRLYIDELKELLRMYPENGLRDRLAAAVAKRRDRLYHREGYSQEEVPRAVPNVLVLDLLPEGGLPDHPDAGVVMSNDLVFAMRQFGRMNAIGVSKRGLAEGLKADGDFFAPTMEKIQSLITSGDLPDVDFIVYGTFAEQYNRFSQNLTIMDFKKAMVIGNFSVSDLGRGGALRLALRSAKRIYDKIPFKGKILKVNDSNIIVSLGLIDGITKDSKLTVYKYGRGQAGRRIVFTVTEADTFLCAATPQRPKDIDIVDVHDEVAPVENRRAKLIGAR